MTSSTRATATPTEKELDLSTPVVFRISPLIRLTLLLLYAALTLPLPFLARVTQAAIPLWLLGLGLLCGAFLLFAALSERVIASETQLEVTYPAWAKWFWGLPLWRRGWSLRWDEMTALKPRSTGQGGIVYYFLDQKAERAFLLPMRVVGFARLTRIVQAKTDIDMRDVKPLAQPWMYMILLGCTLLLFLIDGWVLWTGLTAGFPIQEMG